VQATERRTSFITVITL